jgi:hypothetical protein
MDFRFPVIIPRSAIGIVQVNKIFSDLLLLNSDSQECIQMHQGRGRFPKQNDCSNFIGSLQCMAFLRKWEDDPGVSEADRLLSTFKEVKSSS